MGRIEMDGKYRKRKLAQISRIWDYERETSVKFQNPGTVKIISKKQKMISEIRDKLRHKRKLNHDFILNEEVASQPGRRQL